MPQNIEEMFTANGLSPLLWHDIRSKCSCRQSLQNIGCVTTSWAIASEDPFVLFQLRGRTKDQIIAANTPTAGCSVEANKHRHSRKDTQHNIL